MAHKEQIEFCTEIKNRHPDLFNGKFVLDIGSLDINGNNGYLFDNCLYVGVDVAVGKNVDIVSKGHMLNLPDETFDSVISTECFEHDQYYAQTLQNIIRMLKPGGIFLFTCATSGRSEHGTRQTSPQDAPLLQGMGEWGDYYKNLEEKDIREAIDVDYIFTEYSFSINEQSHDLYFFGIKCGILAIRSDYSFLIQNHIFSNEKQLYDTVALLQNNLNESDTIIGALQESLIVSEKDKNSIAEAAYEQIKIMQSHLIDKTALIMDLTEQEMTRTEEQTQREGELLRRLNIAHNEMQEIERVWNDRMLEVNLLFEEKYNLLEEQNKLLQNAIEQAQIDKTALIMDMSEKEKKRIEEQGERERELRERLSATQLEIRELLTLAHDLEKACIGLSSDIKTIQRSFSWRITSPMRAVAYWFSSNKEENTKIFSSNTQNITHLNAKPLQSDNSKFKSESNTSSTEETMPAQFKNYSTITTLDEILALYNEDFVNAAYQLLLKRNPDSEGLQYYTNRIRRGISKIDVLGQLRNSSEGQKQSELFPNLDKTIQRYRRAKWPIIGSLFVDQNQEAQMRFQILEDKLHAMEATSTNKLNHLVGSVQHLQGNISVIKENLKNIEKLGVNTALSGNHNTSSLELKDYDVVMQSGMFNINYYLQTYPDIALSGIDPLAHYLDYGWKEGRNPSPEFNTNFFLAKYPDIKNSGMNPLLYCIKFDILEDRILKSADDNFSENCRKLIQESHNETFPSNVALENFGANFISPIVSVYLRLLEQYVKEKHQVFCLAREGYFINSIIEQLIEKKLINMSEAPMYLQVSRTMLFRSLLDDERAHEIIFGNNFTGTLKELFLKKFQFDFSLIKDLLTDDQQKYIITLPAEIDVIKTIISDNSKKIRNISEPIRKRIKVYFNSVGMLTEKKVPLFLDIGYSGTIQKLITLLIEKQTEGFYFIASKSGSFQFDKYIVTMSGAIKEDVQFGQNYPLLDRSLYLESLLTAPHGQIVDLYIQPDNKIKFLHGRYSNLQKYSHELEALHKGAQEAIVDIYKNNVYFSTEEIEELFSVYISNKNAIPASIYHLLEVEDEVSGNSILNAKTIFGEN